MKPQFVLACILAVACLVSQKALALPPDLTTSWEAREYVRAIAENVHETAVAILSVPPEQQTFENTLQPWDRLSEQLFQDYDTLHELVEARISSSTAAAEAFEDLHTFLIEITQNPQLCQKLVQCAQRSVER
jgi:Zn-dependent oligopeptidase